MPGQTLLEKSGIARLCVMVLTKLGAVSLFGMMCLTTVDVVGRYLFNRPVVGAFELTEFLVLILIFSYLPFTQAQDGHVAVELVVSHLPKPARTAISLFNHLIAFFLMALFTWKGIEKGLEFIATGENSPNLGLPSYPFAFYMSFGCLVMCLEYLRNIFQLFQTQKEDGW